MEVTTDINIQEDNPFSPQILKALTSFLNIGPRYRFAFVRNEDKVLHVPSVNVGYCVASYIKDNEHSDLKAECFSYIKQLIAIHTQHHPEIGKYVYLKNIGILFEPEIGLDVSIFLSNISRNTLLLIDWNGEMVYPYLYFLHSGSKYKLKLSQLNYITI